MSSDGALSRRQFAKRLGITGLGALSVPLLAARGREALAGAIEAPRAAGPEPGAAAPSAPIRLDSNENPNGPGAAALQRIRDALGETGRYPDAPADTLREAIARLHKAPVENVIAGCGSTEILKMAVAAFTSPARALITAVPSFEAPNRYAGAMGSPVITVPVNGGLELDLEGMAARAAGAGLIYVCNPNNPTATVRPASAVKQLVSRVLEASPDATLLIDEAYHEYVEDSRHATAIPLALEHPRVIVARTFSKVHGLAGLRVGYAVARSETVRALARHRLMDSVNLFGAVAALAALQDPDHVAGEIGRNRDARDFTRRFFETAGYRVGPSETNFLMVDLRRDSDGFRSACRERTVMVGRPFPPLTTHARISIGTLDEMRRATEVFRAVLAGA